MLEELIDFKYIGSFLCPVSTNVCFRNTEDQQENLEFGRIRREQRNEHQPEEERHVPLGTLRRLEEEKRHVPLGTLRRLEEEKRCVPFGTLRRL